MARSVFLSNLCIKCLRSSLNDICLGGINPLYKLLHCSFPAKFILTIATNMRSQQYVFLLASILGHVYGLKSPLMDGTGLLYFTTWNPISLATELSSLCFG
jgi:hypothetical protein